MRWVLAAILVLLGTVPAPAQQRLGRVILEDGRSFQGVVLHVDKERIQLEVDGRRLTFKADRIAEYETLAGEPDPATSRTEADPDGTEANAESGTGTGKTEAQDPETTGGEDTTPAAQTGESETHPAGARPPAKASEPVGGQQPSTTSLRLSMLNRRIGPLAERYPWLSPNGTLQIAGVALLAVLYLTLAMQLGAWFADAERREVPKALATAIVALGATVVQLATVPFDFVTLPMLLVGNIVGWLLVTRILYGLGFFASCTMFFCAVLMCGMAFGLFELANYVLASPGVSAIAG